MTDTPDHIKKIQLEIWLSKTPAVRPKQFCNDNDILMQYWKKGGDQLKSAVNQLQEDSATRAGAL